MLNKAVIAPVSASGGSVAKQSQINNKKAPDLIEGFFVLTKTAKAGTLPTLWSAVVAFLWQQFITKKTR
ncbi:MAG: hypothetical protein A3B90_01015 [Candidatus Magasanikbacteria bacterium RIFCSPHIGHO2_02_FULL_41_13]|uniref:Uncharacterized protein n=1 Tax=Candidatus Magasanikbacteria bacterium RIFCSPHIGHO2_02_FULL_41_13 TaxID=1798676 RepID=A0A1F6M4S8_9BACT|nr:MAG: hypothetical protein A3B90_01015 [Candidatus Magasanikbacteria bacterium RIFCSPHIGHO2_02_FULL_41_13]